MHFETLVPFLAIALWIALTVLKRRKAPPGGGAKKSPDWLQKVESVITRIRDEIEAQNRGTRAPSAGGKRPPPLRPPETVWDKNAGIDLPPPLRLEEEVEEEVLIEKAKVPVRIKKPGLQGKEIAVEELRKAVVWSEILAPPMGLREE